MATLTRKPPVCKNLRTKVSYVPADRSPDYLRESSPTAQYWCLRTMQSLGPDDRVVCPEECQTGRKCFVPLGPSML